jgi:DNA modification methylase
MASDGIKAQMCVTSPPYFGLRDYGHEGQIGLEQTPEQYIAAMVEVFRCVRDVLSDDGTLWLNIGDSYYNYRPGVGQRQGKKSIASQKFSEVEVCHKRGLKLDGLKEKDLIGIPWMLAFALRADGWYLRQDIIWHKPNPMPESVRDRCTKAHEYLFLLSKSERYFFDSEAMQEPSAGWPIKGAKTRGNTGYAAASGVGKSPQRDANGGLGGDGQTRNRRSVWTVATKPYKGAHFATFPPPLIEPCILAGSRPNDVVLDPFMGSGTTAQVSTQTGRQYIGCELNPEYVKLHHMRMTTIGMAL